MPMSKESESIGQWSAGLDRDRFLGCKPVSSRRFVIRVVVRFQAAWEDGSRTLEPATVDNCAAIVDNYVANANFLVPIFFRAPGGEKFSAFSGCERRCCLTCATFPYET